MSDPYAVASSFGVHYFGDINLKYGGVFYDTDNWKSNGYSNAVRITDLDSDCGFTGAVMIEHLTVIKPKDMSDALNCLGLDPKCKNVHEQIMACLFYGHYDPESNPEVIQTDPEAPMKYDGWKAGERIPLENLNEHINTHLKGEW